MSNIRLRQLRRYDTLDIRAIQSIKIFKKSYDKVTTCYDVFKGFCNVFKIRQFIMS